MTKVSELRGSPQVQGSVADVCEDLDRRLAAVEDVIANPKPWLKAAAAQPDPVPVDPKAKPAEKTPAEFLAPKAT